MDPKNPKNLNFLAAMLEVLCFVDVELDWQGLSNACAQAVAGMVDTFDVHVVVYSTLVSCTALCGVTATHTPFSLGRSVSDDWQAVHMGSEFLNMVVEQNNAMLAPSTLRDIAGCASMVSLSASASCVNIPIDNRIVFRIAGFVSPPRTPIWPHARVPVSFCSIPI